MVHTLAMSETNGHAGCMNCDIAVAFGVQTLPKMKDFRLGVLFSVVLALIDLKVGMCVKVLGNVVLECVILGKVLLKCVL